MQQRNSVRGLTHFNIRLLSPLADMGSRFTKQKPLEVPPLPKFPLTFPESLTHQPLKITNVLVILDAKGQVFMQKYFSVKTPLIECIRSYVDLCNLVFTGGELRDKIVAKTHYQTAISDFHVDGTLKLKIMERKLILSETSKSTNYIKESVVSTDDGLLLEDKCYIESNDSLRQFNLEDDVESLKKNLAVLMEDHTPSQVRKIIHQSYKRSKISVKSSSSQSQNKKSRKGISLQQPEKVIGNFFQKSGYSVSYRKQSTSLSLFSLLCVSGGLEGNYYEGQVDISQWNLKLSDIKDDQIKRIVFIYELKEQLSKQLRISPNDIYISEMNQNRATVAYPHPSRSKLISNEKKIFDHLQFSQNDFDRRGNRNYKQERNIVQTRGGYPYYRPVGWFRFGINITSYSEKDGDKKWIANDNNPNEWAVLYHGVRNPDRKIQPGISTANAIAKFGLKVGNTHAHQKVAPLLTKNTVRVLKSKNISIDKYLSEQIYTITSVQDYEYETKSFDNQLGEGVYGSPLLNQICVDQDYVGKFVIDDTEYLLAFQCRVRPESIYISSKQKRYWLVRSPKDVRPYGILVTKRKYLGRESAVQGKQKISEAYSSFCKQEDIF